MMFENPLVKLGAWAKKKIGAQESCHRTTNFHQTATSSHLLGWTLRRMISGTLSAWVLLGYGTRAVETNQMPGELSRLWFFSFHDLHLVGDQAESCLVGVTLQL